MKKLFFMVFAIMILFLSTFVSNAQNYWTTPYVPVVKDICFANDRFVGIDKTKIFISADGDSWDMDTVIGFNGKKIYFDGFQFIVPDKDRIWKSPDARSWKYKKVSGDMNDVVFGKAKFVSVGKDGVINISNDSWNWDPKKYSNTSLYGVAWTGKKFVAVGDGGTIITSDDGESWAAQKSGVSTTLRGVCWNGSKLVVIGDNNTIITSDAIGSTWTKRTYTDSSTNNFSKIVWGKDKFYVISADKIISSKDGVEWRLNSAFLSDSLVSFATNGKKHLAVDYAKMKIFESNDELSWKDKAVAGSPVLKGNDMPSSIKYSLNSSLAKREALTEIIASQIEAITLLTESYRNNQKSKEQVIAELESKLNDISDKAEKVEDLSKFKDIIGRVVGVSRELILTIEDSESAKAALTRLIVPVIKKDSVFRLDRDKNGNIIIGTNLIGGTKFVIDSKRISEVTLKLDAIVKNANEIKAYAGSLGNILTENSSISFEVDMTPAQDRAIEIELPWQVLRTVSEKGVVKVVVKTPIGELTLNTPAIKTSYSNALISFKYLSDKKYKGEAYEFIVKENGKKIDAFENDLLISIPYTLKKGEMPEDITAYFVVPKGDIKNIAGIYDAKAKSVKFKTKMVNVFVLNANPIKFNDITGSWAATYIGALASKGIINGTGNGLVNPNSLLTRAEFVTMICNIIKIDPLKTKSVFKDVADSNWFAPFVAAGYQNGLLSGYADGTFKPQNPVTREEMAAIISKILVKYMKKDALVKSQTAAQKFTDFANINSYAVDAVSTAYKYGIIKGNKDKFLPKDKATRAEAAVVIYKLLMMLYQGNI